MIPSPRGKEKKKRKFNDNGSASGQANSSQHDDLSTSPPMKRKSIQNGPSCAKPIHSASMEQSFVQEPVEPHLEFDEEQIQAIGSRDANVIPLTEDYRQQVRPFIDLIDKLRAFGLDQDVRLPAVAVIGDQSAGKSSALEAISGIQLPRGKGIVTRCPLVLRLKSKVPQPGYWSGHIQYTDSDEIIVQKNIDDPMEVTELVKEAQNAIAGASKGISKKVITLDVVSEEVPDLTLIDLPGITRVAVEGQPQDIGEQIKALITERIQQQETIILAVVPANVDIATNEALQLAKKFDKQGGRTLGVVTKPDLIDVGTESELIAVLNNESYKLKKGYTCVKCRGQQKLDESQTLQEALNEEERFFQTNAHFRDVEEDLLGVRNLSKKLTCELVEKIKKTIPALKGEVEQKAYETKKRLDKLGAGLPEEKGQVTAYVMRMLTSYTDKVKHECEHALFKKARDVFTELMMNISAKCPDADDANFMDKVKAECVKNRGNELPRFLNYQVFKGLIIDIIDSYVSENNTCMDKVNRMMDKVIVELVDEKFAHLPGLAGQVKKRVTGVRQKEYEICKNQLNEIISMEKLVFAQDRIYNQELKWLREWKPSKPVPYVNDQHSTFGSSTTVGISAPQRVIGVDQDYDETIAKDMCKMVKAFIKVSNRRMVDYVPLTISLHLIENVWKNIRAEVPLMATEEDIFQKAREDNRIVAERKKLSQKLERLELAHAELMGY